MELDIILDRTSFRFPFYETTDELVQPETDAAISNSLKELRQEEKIDRDEFKECK